MIGMHAIISSGIYSLFLRIISIYEDINAFYYI